MDELVPSLATAIDKAILRFEMRFDSQWRMNAISRLQAQVLELLREQLNLTILFITHDLRVAAHLCDTMAVMLNGKIVECGSAQDVFLAPKHEYTRALLAAAPRMPHFAPASA